MKYNVESRLPEEDLKESPPWGPPLRGGTRKGGRGAQPPPRTPMLRGIIKLKITYIYLTETVEYNQYIDK